MLHLDATLAAAGAAVAFMLCAWLLSLPLRNASIADVFWGPTLAAASWVAYITGDPSDRSLLLAVLVTAWALRLALHIGIRNLGHGEDRRYAALRRRDGDGFKWRSLWSIFGIQAAIAWIVTLPVQAAASDPTPDGVGAIAVVGTVIALAGLLTESVSDLQLRRFLSTEQSGGNVMQTGVWSWSRHPNYFGDALFWWGIYVVAVEAGSPWWTAVAPALMTFILLRISGVSLLEKTIESRRPGYAAYARRTSAFIPRPPRKV